MAMTGTIYVLGIHPGALAVGFALVSTFPTREQGMVHWHGHLPITAGGGRAIFERIRSEVERTWIAAAVQDRMAVSVEWDDESPTVTGICLGAVWSMRLKPEPEVYTPRAKEWLGPTLEIPRCGSEKDGFDPLKRMRVMYVEELYRLGRGSLGPQEFAGSVADAILIARYGLEQEKRAFALSRAGAEAMPEEETFSRRAAKTAEGEPA